MAEPEDTSPRPGAMTQNEFRELWEYVRAVWHNTRDLRAMLPFDPAMVPREGDTPEFARERILHQLEVEIELARTILAHAAACEPGLEWVKSEYDNPYLAHAETANDETNPY
jgi:hypothetical protein